MNLTELKISPIVPSEVKILRSFAISIFGKSYAHLNTAENMQHYLDRAFSEVQLYKELNDPASSFFFVKLGKEILGYLKVNFAAAQTDLYDPKSLEVERIYVAQKYQGKKIGQQLLEKAIQIGLDQGLDYLWLGVWRKNPGAIAFYKKIGFVEFGTHAFQFGTEEQVDILMKRNLST